MVPGTIFCWCSALAGVFCAGVLFWVGLRQLFEAGPNLSRLLPVCYGLALLAAAGYCVYGAVFTRHQAFSPLLRGVAVLCTGFIWYWPGLSALLLLFAAVCAFRRPTLGCDADVLLVLGCTPRKKQDCELHRRLEKALEYSRTQKDPAVFLLSGGNGEAAYMRRYLLQRGVPGSRLLTEESSRSTKQNFALCKPVLQRLGAKNTVFVTGDYHVFRSGLYAKKAGVRARGIGCKNPAPQKVLGVLREGVAFLGDSAQIFVLYMAALVLWQAALLF